MEKNTSNEKLKMQDIKKNSSTEISHTIKKIKLEERQLVLIVAFVLLFIGSIIFVVAFSNIPADEKDSIGPLTIDFMRDDGMGDIVSFSEDNAIAPEGTTYVKVKVHITNESSKTSKYAIYLDDYLDMVKYDECAMKSIDKEKIFFRVDDKEDMSLNKSYKDGRYLIYEGEVLGKSEIINDISVWHKGDSKKHYHGQIIVEYIK